MAPSLAALAARLRGRSSSNSAGAQKEPSYRAIILNGYAHYAQLAHAAPSDPQLNNSVPLVPKNNRISTAKYTWWSLVPKFLFEQFMRLANLYFLIISIIQVSNVNLAPTGQYYTISPLVVILFLTGVKEAVEDFRRHRADDEVNNRTADVLIPNTPPPAARPMSASFSFPSSAPPPAAATPNRRSGTFFPKRWQDLVIGDIVRLENGESIPADILLISTSEEESMAYVETSNLDGETNLKIKQGPARTAYIRTPQELAELRGEVHTELPNDRLYTFDGTLVIDGERFPLTPTQILLRGCTLKQTAWAYGVVIFTGHETKLLLNAHATPIKKSKLERMVNRQILALFGLLFLIAIIETVGLYVGISQNIISRGAWYLPNEPLTWQFWASQFIIYIVLFNTIIPISLYVTVEFVKLVQAYLISADKDMYDEENNCATIARTSNLNEELGQVEYIFSDKTGTLTRNMMEFRRCTIAGLVYGLNTPQGQIRADPIRHSLAKIGKRVSSYDGSEEPEPHYNFYDPSLLDNLTQGHSTASLIREFLRVLAVCHTIIVEKKEDGTSVYQAASPDEEALVIAAKKLGFRFQARSPKTVTISVFGVEEVYEILAVNEFTSTRKRMSVVVRTPENRIAVYCKGADSVILERLRSVQQPFRDSTKKHLDEFAIEGLRTLCVAFGQLTNEQYLEWSKTFNDAATAMDSRVEKLELAAEEVEKNLILLGATAIEDKLQTGVPETIQALKQANIKIWMLTGDKKETATNIAVSACLVTSTDTLLDMSEDAFRNMGGADISNLEKYLNQEIDKRKAELGREAPMGKGDFPLSPLHSGPNPDGSESRARGMAVVVDGAMLLKILDGPVRLKFLELCNLCTSVVCCRVSPLQKASIVSLVKKNVGAITLAIGDGANDVTMIQAAHVGVGVIGKEGMQASRSSDYAIGQFQFLKPLLLVHGAWSYQRLSKLVLYSFYKTLTLYMVSFYFSFENGFSGQVPWDNLSNTLWNVIFTVFGIVAVAVFDRPLSRDTMMTLPALYMSGQQNKFFNLRAFFGWFFTSIWHSLIIYLFTRHLAFDTDTNSVGMAAGTWAVGTALYSITLITVTAKLMITMRTYTWVNYVTLFGTGLGLYYIYVLFLSFVSLKLNDTDNVIGIAQYLFRNPLYWLAVVIVVATCLLRDFAWKFLKRTYLPEPYHFAQEAETDQERRNRRLHWPTNPQSSPGDPSLHHRRESESSGSFNAVGSPVYSSNGGILEEARP